jgi:26S proteasome regulatory subunit N2
MGHPVQDDKADPKKDVDVDMKVDESSPSPKHGDVSPINGFISNLAEDSKALTSKPQRKIEPSSEVLPNFSRVTPAQLAHIVFPADGRYQPVRAVTAMSTQRNGKAVPTSVTTSLGLASEKYAGGGGILILTDLRPDEEAEYINLNPAPALEVASDSVPNGHALSGPPAAGPHLSIDEAAPEADPPESFEVSAFSLQVASIC